MVHRYYYHYRWKYQAILCNCLLTHLNRRKYLSFVFKSYAENDIFTVWQQLQKSLFIAG